MLQSFGDPSSRFQSDVLSDRRRSGYFRYFGGNLCSKSYCITNLNQMTLYRSTGFFRTWITHLGFIVLS